MQVPAARRVASDPVRASGPDAALPLLPHDWPNRHLSRFVDAAGLRWHVQCKGDGARPVLLLLHGTGAATNSWRDLIEPLSTDFTVVAPDLPGHGFTSAMPGGVARLDGIASALWTLMQALGLAPEFIVGHSAGAAISARMALSEISKRETWVTSQKTAGSASASESSSVLTSTKATTLRRLLWLAGALCPMDGLPGRIASPLANVLAHAPFVARLAAWRASDPAVVGRFIAATGSTLDARGNASYRELLHRPSHVAGALAMMAGWDLAPLQRALPALSTPVLLLHGDADRTVPPTQSDEVARRLPHAEVVHLPGLGHLAHEERPAQFVQLIREWLLQQGASPHDPA